MTALLRPASTALATALAGGVRLWSADLLTFTLADGVTVLDWTTWDQDLTCASVLYSSKRPWLSRSTWNVANTMQVPTLTVKALALNDSFAGGASLKTQLHNGLFDGAAFVLQRAYMTTPGAADALGAIALFGGEVGPIDLDGVTASIQVKGKTNKLDQYAPRALYQIGCNHAFCDVGCTLNRASFTNAFTVGSAPTSAFIPWSGTPPSNAALYQNGTLVMTSGAASGSRRTISAADSAGLFLAYPLPAVPASGDGFTAFEGCDKSYDSGSGQSCTDRSNTENYDGFEFVPPPNSAY